MLWMSCQQMACKHHAGMQQLHQATDLGISDAAPHLAAPLSNSSCECQRPECLFHGTMTEAERKHPPA